MKTAFLYVGQGSQKVGMAKKLLDKYSVARQVFDRANNALGWSVEDLCVEDKDGKLNETKWTQPALLTHSYAAHQVAIELGYNPDYIMGLSLGEYSAITANGALSLEDGVKLVHARGKIMQEAVPSGVGAMYAILGLSLDKIEEVCKKHSDKGVIAPANINCPGQIVIAGQKAVVEGAITDLKAAGAKRCLPVNAAGPFHTEMLKEAAIKFRMELEKVTFNQTNVDLITNTTGEIINMEAIVDNLAKQMYCPVQLEKGIKYLLDQGVTRFIELGPNKVLCGLVRKTAKHYGFDGIEMFNIEDKIGE